MLQRLPIQLVENFNKIVFIRKLSSTTSIYSRLRSEWRVDRKPANTKLGETDIIERRKAYGGREKFKAIQISRGIFSLPSQNFEETLPIIDVLHSDAGKHYREQKIMAKGTVVKVDISNHLDTLTTDSIRKNENDDIFSRTHALAEITSRPGQVGACNGVILENEKLLSVLEKLKMYENS